MSEIQTLTEGIINRQFVRIRYQKPNKEFKKPLPGGRVEQGDVVIRKVEPYEIKEKGSFSYLWAVDSQTNTIKSFKIDNIKKVSRLMNSYLSNIFSITLNRSIN